MRAVRRAYHLVLAASLTACAAGPQQFYRPEGETGPAWPIDGDFNAITYDLRVFVNGEPAAVGNLWYTDTPLMITGSYQGHPVRAECAQYQAPPGSVLMVLCDVFIDGVRTALLTLD
jgi:hypothetical protein